MKTVMASGLGLLALLGLGGCAGGTNGNIVDAAVRTDTPSDSQGDLANDTTEGNIVDAAVRTDTPSDSQNDVANDTVIGDALSRFYSLHVTTSWVADAASARTVLMLRVTGGVTFFDGTVSIDAVLTDGERQELRQLVNAPGALDELLSPQPCGPANADFTQSLVISTAPTGQVDKEITNCQQAPYKALRAFIDHIRDNHFRFAPGTCPAPNVWRYMSPGCGAEARPICGSPQGDACAVPRCSCTGRDIIGCDFTSEPYAYVGSCHHDGGGQ